LNAEGSGKSGGFCGIMEENCISLLIIGKTLEISHDMAERCSEGVVGVVNAEWSRCMMAGL